MSPAQRAQPERQARQERPSFRQSVQSCLYVRFHRQSEPLSQPEPSKPLEPPDQAGQQAEQAWAISRQTFQLAVAQIQRLRPEQQMLPDPAAQRVERVSQPQRVVTSARDAHLRHRFLAASPSGPAHLFAVPFDLLTGLTAPHHHSRHRLRRWKLLLVLVPLREMLKDWCPWLLQTLPLPAKVRLSEARPYRQGCSTRLRPAPAKSLETANENRPVQGPLTRSRRIKAQPAGLPDPVAAVNLNRF
jgi:hypothetical protein